MSHAHRNRSSRQRGARGTPRCAQKHAAGEEPRSAELNEVYGFFTAIQFLLKGAETVAAVSAILIIFATAALDNRVERVTLWFVTCLFAFVTLAKWLRGSLVTTMRMNAFDVVLPFCVGGAELSMFLVLVPLPGLSAFPVDAWYLAFAVHSAFAWAFVYNRRMLTSSYGVVANQRHYQQMLGWMGKDLRGILACGALSSLAFGLHRSIAGAALPLSVCDVGLAAVLAVVAVRLIAEAMFQRQTILSA